jgi:hypothetical protein
MTELITIKSLRELLAEKIGEVLQPQDYVIDKKLTAFERKDKLKNKIKIFFDCYNYSPSRIEFRLLFLLNIHVLDVEIEKLYKNCGEHYDKQWATMILSEGDFHPRSKDMEHKFRNAATHIISDRISLESEVEDCARVLSLEILPQLNIFMVLENFQKFIADNHHLVTHLNLVIPGLVAMKLYGEDSLKGLVSFLNQDSELRSSPHNSFIKKMIDNILLLK